MTDGESTKQPPLSVGRMQRAVGCIVGSAVGDALGAPFEFGPAGEYSKRFPHPVHGGIGEMVGGGGFAWEPGQFTDDTEMAVIVAESLIAEGDIDADDQLHRFRAWGATASDVGNLTREVLRSGRPAAEAATLVLRARGGRHTAGNGSLMRAAPGAVHFAAAGRDATMTAARQLSAVTHADPLCRWAVAIQHELIRIALDGQDPLDKIEEILALLPDPERSVFSPLLAPSWRPAQGGPGNGSAMGALAQSLWAQRECTSFADVVTSVIDLGDDTDSVAAVAGALAGARFGIQAIPSRWVSYLHGRVAGVDGRIHHYDHLALHRLAMTLIGCGHPPDPPDEPALELGEIAPGLWATNRGGARTLSDDRAVISLCRIDQSMRRQIRREAFLIDRPDDENPLLELAVDDVLDSIDALLHEGRQVVVHGRGGRSRTALVLTAHLMRHGRSLAEAKAHLNTVLPQAQLANNSFVAELDRRAGWANVTDGWIIERLCALSGDDWNQLRVAADAVDGLEVPYTWCGGEQVDTMMADGLEHSTIQMPWVEYAPEVRNLVSRIYSTNVMLSGFDWGGWLTQTPLRNAFVAASTFDADQLSFADAARMITAIVRSDRFNEGALAARLDDRSLLAILRVLGQRRPPPKS